MYTSIVRRTWPPCAGAPCMSRIGWISPRRAFRPEHLIICLMKYNIIPLVNNCNYYYKV